MPELDNNAAKITQQVMAYLEGNEVSGDFSTGEVEGLKNNSKPEGRSDVIRKFVDLLKFKTQDELLNDPVKTKRFSQNVIRILISVTKDNGYLLTEENVNKAKGYFQNTDLTNYVDDKVGISSEFIGAFNLNKKSLKPNDLLPGPEAWVSIFGTVGPRSELVNTPEKKEGLAYLMAGVVAKLGGQSSNLVPNGGPKTRNEMTTTLRNNISEVYKGVIEVLEENPAFLDRSKEDLMKIGKSIGKIIREYDVNTQKNMVKELIKNPDILNPLVELNAQNTNIFTKQVQNLKKEALISKIRQSLNQQQGNSR